MEINKKQKLLKNLCVNEEIKGKNIWRLMKMNKLRDPIGCSKCDTKRKVHNTTGPQQ